MNLNIFVSVILFIIYSVISTPQDDQCPCKKLIKLFKKEFFNFLDFLGCSVPS